MKKKKLPAAPKKAPKKRTATAPLISPDPTEIIQVVGARVHNLKNISVAIPRDQLVVITGLSGCGKSSLAFDTIYSEGQRRYVESLSNYAKQFIPKTSKPEVERIDGLSPTISIEQKTTSFNPRSTVGTVTELWDYLRVLFARVATPYCYQCGKPIESQSLDAIVEQIMLLPRDARVTLYSPIVRERKGEYQKELQTLRSKGFVRVRVDGETKDLQDEIRLDRNKKHSIDVVIDRIILRPEEEGFKNRVTESVDLALKLSNGLLVLSSDRAPEKLFSQQLSCPTCEISYPLPEPRTFSFNSQVGACAFCNGLGIDPKAIDVQEAFASSDREEIPADPTPETHPCPKCKGARLKQESLAFKINGLSIVEVANHSLARIEHFFSSVIFYNHQKIIAQKILEDFHFRVRFLNEVGVGYLSLMRSAQSLSGGEAQRIRLATQLGSALVGVIYVLDEPSIGLHQRDNQKLIHTLQRLRDKGNSVLVVEHDEETILAADHVIDMGPGAGARGGEILFSGKVSALLRQKNSVTAQYLRKEKFVAEIRDGAPIDLKKINRITLKGLNIHNLKNIDVTIPLGKLVCFTGVSGSGKSSIVMDTLYPALMKKLHHSKLPEPQLKSLAGLENIDRVIDIDQSPIGRTPRSNPATYTGVFTFIRDLFSKLPESLIRGYKPGQFSFNVAGGRCEHCEGGGLKKIEMHFMPNVYVLCEVCRGKRYNPETLRVLFKGKSIADVLQLTIEESLGFFEAQPHIRNKLKTLNDVGLGYLTLGQSATTLSGGEAQRLKLSKELSKRATGKTLYILDEPTTGLHFDDVKKLVTILHALVAQGNSVLVIEHQLDLIRSADYVIDIGPEGGDGGGEVVAYGRPQDLKQFPKSITAQFI